MQAMQWLKLSTPGLVRWRVIKMIVRGRHSPLGDANFNQAQAKIVGEIRIANSQTCRGGKVSNHTFAD